MDDPAELRAGLLAYRAGRYFDAHELWEQRWRTETDASRRICLQALIQLAAALHKISTGIRPAGAPALLAKCDAKLTRLAADDERPFGIDPASLRQKVRTLAAGLEPKGGGAGPGPVAPPLP